MKPHPCRSISLFLVLAILIGSAAGLRAQSQTTALSDKVIPNVQLTDQDGHVVHFYTDLIKGKVVAINTIFTSCTTICPIMGARFASLSRMLANEDPSKVRLISISIDPETDTPKKLKAWSHQFGEISPNWTLLTGKESDVDTLLKALELFTADKQSHTPVIVVGVGGSANWSRVSALMPTAQIAKQVRARLASISTSAASRPGQ